MASVLAYDFGVLEDTNHEILALDEWLRGNGAVGNEAVGKGKVRFERQERD